MNFLANSDALIVDLRENGGGAPAMIQLLSSYLFSGEPPAPERLLLPAATTRPMQFWTQPYVPGARLADSRPYVLTSRRTFSGAEEFTYNLKNLKRATIVGETTGGGAHPVQPGDPQRRLLDRASRSAAPSTRSARPTGRGRASSRTSRCPPPRR